MRFWDSSALVPLCIKEPRTKEARGVYARDPGMVVWWASPVECASALARLRREGGVDEEGEAAARSVLLELAELWNEIQPTASLRHEALRLLRLYPLTAADSLQLAAALEWAGGSSKAEFITFDERLRRAARMEGFAA